ncbi:MAG TPA: hypothetical protein VFB01_05710 [Burkholderiales bacterium]|nr:hypothetical protein [Burkholderiales bacterium]
MSTASVVLPTPPAALAGADALARDVPLAQVKAAIARARPLCTVFATSRTDHTVQLYSGLYALRDAGCIRLRQRHARAAAMRRLGAEPIERSRLTKVLENLLVDVEGAGLVFFDVRDSGAWFPEVAERVALYAKRSFRSGAYGGARGRFVPLGLNYAVVLDRTCAAELVRALAQVDGSAFSLKRVCLSLVRLVPPLGAALGAPTVSRLSAAPAPEVPPRAIFFARTWEPVEADDVGFDVLNETRAACIRALREAFGPRFLGGFSRTPHACRRYPDCVVDADVSTRRGDYLRRLPAYPVCVATTGLYGSIGWKFAEYVALSKAIVSEPLEFEAPGPMAPGENYLAFATPDECVGAVARLFADRDLRSRMMARNREYYLEHGSPDAIVARVLHAALAPGRF